MNENPRGPTPSEHPRFAKLYPAAADTADQRGAAEHRKRLVAGLSGRVVEVGAGDGRNFAYYPPEVTEVVAIEPEGVPERVSFANAGLLEAAQPGWAPVGSR